ncbi:FixH family protein [Chromobacterium vaccinii]|uniref:FixH family protein n=1 Tax=Chromobacterium vaccinii TaxID=1108595 RepID=UPI00061811D9|nr:FixH family protein [Chromobacterium vaccinii]QND86648.1 FixH family protein [Chromobacterium vaccinii]QND91879.1 FixH family protein [Chromobacterium vaccinii]
MQHTAHHPSRPWYKEPWPWILFGLPAVSVVVGIFFLMAAIKSDDGLVTDDYYKKGKAINMELRRDKAAAQMGLSAQLMFGSDGRSLRLVTSSKVKLPDTLSLSMIHPAQDDYDLSAVMTMAGPNLYQGILPKIPVNANHWYVQLEDHDKKWRIQGEWKPGSGQMAMLGQPHLEPAEH